MLIKHTRTQCTYNADLKSLTVVINGKAFEVTPYVPVPNNDSVLYLRETNDFHSFTIMPDDEFFEIQRIDEYKTIKFKLNGKWLNVPHKALI